MKFFANKAYPHPVLRPGSSDYPNGTFEVDINLERAQKSTEIRVMADFFLGDKDLLELVEHKKAKYMLVARCEKTYFRLPLSTAITVLEHTFPAGQISGALEFSPFLVATCDICDFRAEGWHQDYGDIQALNLKSGAVLAADEPKEYWVDNAEEMPIGSIFELKIGDLPNGRWDCDLNAERIQILMSTDDHRHFCAAREQSASGSVHYIMNSVYLPALFYVLTTADVGEDQYGEYRWFRALSRQLENIGAKPLGRENQNRLDDAQKALAYPFSKLPFMILGVVS